MLQTLTATELIRIDRANLNTGRQLRYRPSFDPSRWNRVLSHPLASEDLT
jgi:hypothetical protein